MIENKPKNNLPALYYPSSLITDKKLAKQMNKKYKDMTWFDIIKEINRTVPLLLLFIFLTNCYSVKNNSKIKIINHDGYYYHAKMLNTEKVRYISMIYDTDTIQVGDTLIFVKVYDIPGLIDFKLIRPGNIAKQFNK